MEMMEIHLGTELANDGIFDKYSVEINCVLQSYYSDIKWMVVL